MADDEGGTEQSIDAEQRRVGSMEAYDWRSSISNRVNWARGELGTPLKPAAVGAESGSAAARSEYRHVYVEDAKRGVGAARRAYRHITRLFWILRGAAITVGVGVAALAASPAPKWILGVLGAVGAGAETVLSAANLQERAVLRGLLADRMARELREYALGVGPYAEGDAIDTLHTRIEALRDEASNARFRLDRLTGDRSAPSDNGS